MGEFSNALSIVADVALIVAVSFCFVGLVICLISGTSSSKFDSICSL